jgi:energy-coupling factor transporter ATP-binding protein EcfA2
LNAVVAIEDLQYAYPPLTPDGESSPILKGVSLSVSEGECLALLGRTGAGKSTLCLTLNGIIPHLTGGTFQGEVRVTGQSTRACGPGELSQAVGLVLQDPESQLLSITVEDEVAFGLEGLALPPKEIGARIDEALAMTGIESLRGRSSLELSGGQKQRVVLAAILAMRPKVLVLDEPTASLDPAGKRSLLAGVDRLRRERGTTVVWATQDLDRVPRLADRVAVLHEGRIALEGGVREVFDRAEALRRLGLGLPQMTELGQRFSQHPGANHRWLTVEEAAEALEGMLDG